MVETYGGQAVIEGVMMKSKTKVATSVRLPNGKIKTKKQRLKKRHKLLTKPFMRGIFVLYDTLVLGVKTLLWSADQQLEKHEKITKKDTFFTLTVSIGLAILFFLVLPFWLTGLIVKKGILFNIIDGLIRLVVFLIYFIIISLFKDVKVLFRYHGAEHKAINCYEAGKKLTIQNVKRFTTLNPRCGTSFIFIVLIISILIFSILHSEFWYINLGARFMLIPVIASLSFEILKISAKFKKNFFMKIIIAPGLLLQKISTKEPDKKQIEVALVALKAVL